MDFTLTEEQQQLRDTLEKFLREQYSFDQRRAISRSGTGWNADVWRQLGELGVLGLTLPEEHGGLGGGAMDTHLVMEQCGRALLLEPYLATIVLGAGLVARAGSAAQKDAILPAVATGQRHLAFAHYEPKSRYATAPLATTAHREADGWRLDGEKTFVLHGATADQLIVSARAAGGVSLLLVDRKATGVHIRGYAMHDALRAAQVRLEAVHVPADALLGEEGHAADAITQTIDAALAATCAEAVGAMGVLIETTGEYLKTRKQFGVPLGTFQVLQHRVADMLLESELARSMALLASSTLGASGGQNRRRVVSAAKVRVGTAARFVGQQAVQLHGGIGVTDELPVSHYFKRLTMIDVAFGDVDYHLGEFIRES